MCKVQPREIPNNLKLSRMSGIVGSHLRLYTIALYRVSVTRDERAPPHLTVRVARASFIKFQTLARFDRDPWRVAPCERTVVMSLHSYCMALLFDICAYASWYAYNLESEIRKVEARPPTPSDVCLYGTATGRCNQLSQWKCLVSCRSGHALDRHPCTASDSAHAVGRPLQVLHDL